MLERGRQKEDLQPRLTTCDDIITHDIGNYESVMKDTIERAVR